MEHLLGDCTEAFTTKLRQDAILAARLEIAQEDDLAHAVFDAILEILALPHGANLYRGVWQPDQIETLRLKLHQSIGVSMDPRALPNDSPLKRRIQASLVKVPTLLAQAGLNIMRHRNTQTQDALHPDRVQQAGRVISSPLGILNSHKDKKKKK